MDISKYAVVPLALAVALTPLVVSAQTVNAARYNYYNYDGYSQSTTSYQGGHYGQQLSSEAQAQVATLYAMSTSSIAMPVLFGVQVRNLTPNFGDPRDGGARTHQGEDIMAKDGTPIVSPTLAVVFKAETGASEGNAVYTINPGGEVFVYMHLSRFGEGVAAGSILQPGALIGYVGNTGDASGGAPHLHFEVHNAAGTPIDPYPRLTVELPLQQKITDLAAILGQTSSSTQLAVLLVTNFRSEFIAALAANIALPQQIIAALASVPVSTVASSNIPTNPNITRNLYKGVVGEDVRTLQKMLNAAGFTVAASGAGSAGAETTYFGPATLAAVIAYQKAHSITPAVGYVGPITRAALAI